MAFRDGIRRLAYAARGLAGIYGIRPYSVALQTRTWSGDEPGEGTETVTTTPITEGGGRPPKVRWLSSEEIALGGLAEGSVEIGPITPNFPGGGTALSAIHPTPADGSTLVNIRLTGPEHPNGANYRVKSVRTDRGYRYMLTLERSADS